MCPRTTEVCKWMNENGFYFTELDSVYARGLMFSACTEFNDTAHVQWGEVVLFLPVMNCVPR